MSKEQKKKGKSNEYDIVIGQNLKKIRKALGISQDNLAQKVGVTFQQIQKYENGKNRISSSMLLMLSKTLNVNIMSFYHGLTDDNICQFNPLDVDTEILKLVNILNSINDKTVVNSLIKLLSR